MAIWYASRARLRQDRGDLKGAEEDIARSIQWGEAQSPRDERSLAIRYASRASIRGAQATVARGEANATEAARLLIQAQADIHSALTWWEQKLPDDERGLRILRVIKASLGQD